MIRGELDRTMLERMVAPLEHMLRNAIDHGIEDAGGRIAAGKSPTGRIILTLGREGSDVLILSNWFSFTSLIGKHVFASLGDLSAPQSPCMSHELT